MHDALLAAINQRSNNDKTNAAANDDQILLINMNLADTIKQVEQRNQLLTAKIVEYKAFKRILKNVESLQCKHCQANQKTDEFSEHLKVCNKEIRHLRSQMFSMPLQISIQQTRINMDQTDNR